MPIIPNEHSGEHITEQIAKDAESKAQEQQHSHHHQHGQGGAQTKATAADLTAAPGPVISENIGKPATKEELKARAEELNKGHGS
ncbi:hypothetical protein BC567DRAFT_228738 [Phyllosticta citribraziliensis]